MLCNHHEKLFSARYQILGKHQEAGEVLPARFRQRSGLSPRHRFSLFNSRWVSGCVVNSQQHKCQPGWFRATRLIHVNAEVRLQGQNCWHEVTSEWVSVSTILEPTLTLAFIKKKPKKTPSNANKHNVAGGIKENMDIIWVANDMIRSHFPNLCQLVSNRCSTPPRNMLLC